MAEANQPQAEDDPDLSDKRTRQKLPPKSAPAQPAPYVAPAAPAYVAPAAPAYVAPAPAVPAGPSQYASGYAQQDSNGGYITNDSYVRKLR